MTNPAVETFFVVVINSDGTLNTFVDLPESLPANRPATNWDVYQAAKQIATEVDNQLLAEKVTNSVLAALAPQTTPVSDKVKEALKERGITPEGE